MDLPLQSWRPLNLGLGRKGTSLAVQGSPPSADPVLEGSRGHNCPGVPEGGAASRGRGPGPSGASSPIKCTRGRGPGSHWFIPPGTTRSGAERSRGGGPHLKPRHWEAAESHHGCQVHSQDLARLAPRFCQAALDPHVADYADGGQGGQRRGGRSPTLLQGAVPGAGPGGRGLAGAAVLAGQRRRGRHLPLADRDCPGSVAPPPGSWPARLDAGLGELVPPRVHHLLLRRLQRGPSCSARGSSPGGRGQGLPGPAPPPLHAAQDVRPLGAARACQVSPPPQPGPDEFPTMKPNQAAGCESYTAVARRPGAL